MWKNLAPNITRQRLIIEGISTDIINDKQIKEYLSKLSKELGMTTLSEPITHLSKKFGWSGWIHWEASGCHFYAFDGENPFFSADIYTCKPFFIKEAVEFTKKFFKAKEIVYKEIKV